MKAKLYLFSALLAAMPLLSSGCSNKNVSDEKMDIMSFGDFCSSDSEIIKKTLSLKNFHGINVISAAQVYYKQGSEYKVVFEGRNCDWKNLDFKVSDGTLVVSHSKNSNWRRVGTLNCKLYITAPRIDRIVCSGSFSFRAESLKTKNLTVSNSGALRLYIDHLKVGTCNISNSGALKNNGTIDAGMFTLTNSGAYTSDARMNISGDMNVNNSGADNINSDIVARNVYWKCYGADNSIINFDAGRLYLTIDGSGKLNGKFKGDDMYVKCDGSAKIDFDVNCSSVTASVEGNGHITLSGTADKTDIGSSGISQIDTSRLNDF